MKIKTAQIRQLESEVRNEIITHSRMIETLNEIANEPDGNNLAKTIQKALYEVELMEANDKLTHVSVALMNAKMHLDEYLQGKEEG